MIYLDYNASTPPDPRVVDALLPYFRERHANAASTDHAAGHRARQAVEEARAEVAKLIGADASEVVFTSGATEADNLAVLGTMAKAADDAELIVSAIEHPAVLEPARRFGDRLRVARVGSDGVVDPDEVRRLLSPKTALVCVMAANNETGALQPVDAIGEVCAAAGVAFHCDAVQAAARLPLDVGRIGVATLALSAHKMYGPQGVGALYVRRQPRARLAAITHGGGHERNLRPGTLNVPAIVGFGVAAQLVREEREADVERELLLRDGMVARLVEVGAAPNVPLALALPQTVNLVFDGLDARALLHRLGDEIAFSTGSACATISDEPSHVLIAQGLSPAETRRSVRLSLGRFTTAQEADKAIALFAAAAASLRRIGRAA